MLVGGCGTKIIFNYQRSHRQNVFYKNRKRQGLQIKQNWVRVEQMLSNEYNVITPSINLQTPHSQQAFRLISVHKSGFCHPNKKAAEHTHEGLLSLRTLQVGEPCHPHCLNITNLRFACWDARAGHPRKSEGRKISLLYKSLSGRTAIKLFHNSNLPSC
ncbi:hypothetical protein CDAR_554521 [Caerostris darwini]|uniref:Uncharacterized protein n=1 Tax=Caerostris darwini TaxID=1538125 RepID=A0AAV4ULX1_9ARAC|nr:hypothetical protein CDAR_554511 [Caerostris darwini]GIY58886.1 hypothetical protein CDAR_554521 [Caerostris darwini]